MSSEKIVVASQLPDSLDKLLRAKLPHIEIRRVARGGPVLDDDITILFAANFPGTQSEWEGMRPKGWPFNLRWIQVISAGTDHYPRWLFEVPVATARGTSNHPVSEFALASMFSVAKHLPDLWIRDAANWNMRSLGTLYGATLGIIGFGAIGSTLAFKAAALGMKVKVLRRSKEPIWVEGVTAVRDVTELFHDSDHVVVLAPATPETHHIVNAMALSHAKVGMHLVNIARGSLVDQEALLQALDSGKVGWASLDVTSPEPLPDGHPLYKHPRVRISPHTAALSEFTEQAIIQKFACNLDRMLSGEQPADLAL